MKDVSDVHFRVVDKGLFLQVAVRLARQARKVSYWTNQERDFPTCHDFYGSGFEGVERVSEIFEDIEDVDCFVFPDIGFCEAQRYLRDQGFPVWGSMGGCELEINRGKFLDKIEEVGLNVPKHEKIKGLANLMDHLKDKEDLWIKVSHIRGDWETFHWRNWEQDQYELGVKLVRLGPFAEYVTFYVFDPIEADIEDGCDAYCIDGQFPSVIIHGMEAKDKAYVGTFQKFADLPEEVRSVSEAFGPALGEYGYRSFFSTEVRITKEDEPFFIDPTCRCGSPPYQSMTEMIENYAEIIWHGAHGKLIDPVDAAKFGVQAIVSVKGDSRNWRSLNVDEPDLERFVKCGRCMKQDGVIWFPPYPDDPRPDVGWLVGIGDSMQEAIDHLKHNISLLGEGANCNPLSLCELLEEVNKAEEAGMEFTDQPVPEPASVIDS